VAEPRNVLLITLDQFRGDSLSCAGHPLVRTPHLDDLAAHGVRLARHYSQAAPCGPGRASLYTGMYQMNHRVVGNGTPLDRRFDNVALVARRAGYEPALFGYTDQSVDPRDVESLDDPRLESYEGILPGFDPVLPMVHSNEPWRRWLGEQGHPVPPDAITAWAGEPDRPAEHSLAAFMTDRLLDWLADRPAGWFVHLSQLRPHPPYAAAGHYSTMYDPADVPPPIEPVPDRHQLHELLLSHPHLRVPDDLTIESLRAQYFGMISEVDAQLGRITAWLRATGAWDDTLIAVTSDHGEQLGDHGYVQKAGWFEQSYHVLGIVRDPTAPAGHGTVVDRFTENVDIVPTICEWLGLDVPAQCDGLPLTPLLRGDEPPWWRDAAHWEFDWRISFIDGTQHWPWDRRLERHHLAVRRTADAAYVHFGDGSSLAYDLAADPTWRTPLTDPAAVLDHAEAMLTWRSTHADRVLADVRIDHGIVGRTPPGTPDAW
jgi:arylsulfatase A-like enzyme